MTSTPNKTHKVQTMGLFVGHNLVVNQQQKPIISNNVSELYQMAAIMQTSPQELKTIRKVTLSWTLSPDDIIQTVVPNSLPANSSISKE